MLCPFLSNQYGDPRMCECNCKFEDRDGECLIKKALEKYLKEKEK